MNLEIAGFFGIFIIVLFAFAETERKRIIGVFASLLLILYGVWIIQSGIQYNTGETAVITEYTVYGGTDIAGTNCSNVTYGSNMNVTKIQNSSYATADISLPSPPFPAAITFKILFGLICILLSLFGMIHYSDGIIHHEDSR